MRLKNTFLTVAAATLAIAAASPAWATDKRSSVSVFGNLIIPEQGDNTGTVFVSYGRLLTDALEVEGGVGQTFTRGFTSTNLSVAAKYYFGAVGTAGKMVPYAKAALTRSSFSGTGFSSSSTGYGLGGGLEFTLTESTSTFVEGTYESSTTAGALSSIVFQVGVKLRF